MLSQRGAEPGGSCTRSSARRSVGGSFLRAGVQAESGTSLRPCLSPQLSLSLVAKPVKTLSPGGSLARVRAREAQCWWGDHHKAGGCPLLQGCPEDARAVLAVSSKSRRGTLGSLSG